MAAWRKLVEASIVDHATPDYSIYSLAEILIVLAHSFPGRVGDFYRSFDLGLRPSDAREFGKDVLPLPRPSLDIFEVCKKENPLFPGLEGRVFTARLRRSSGPTSLL